MVQVGFYPVQFLQIFGSKVELELKVVFFLPDWIND